MGIEPSPWAFPHSELLHWQFANFRRQPKVCLVGRKVKRNYFEGLTRE